MALTLPKFTVFFEQSNGAGWSESFYAQSAADLDSLRLIAQSYINSRIKFLANDCWISYLRFGDASVKRYVQVAQITPSESAGQYPDSTNYSNDAVNIRLVSIVAGGTFHRRSFLIRGVPDGIVNAKDYLNTNGVNTASPWYAAAFAFANTVAPANYAIRYQTGVGPPPTFALAAIAGGIIRRATTRKAGRPFGLPPGRRLTT